MRKLKKTLKTLNKSTGSVKITRVQMGLANIKALNLNNFNNI
jgi:hypothetical protein